MLHPNIRTNAAHHRAVLDFAAEFVGNCLSGRGEAKDRWEREKKVKTSFILAPRSCRSITAPEAWSRSTESLISINALSGFAGPKHRKRRVADAQITALLQSRRNVVGVGRRRQLEDNARRVLMWVKKINTKPKHDNHVSLLGRLCKVLSTASDGVRRLSWDVSDLMGANSTFTLE